MHKSYEKRLGHPADFKVRYRFYTFQEGGRKSIPHQGYRSDFWYDHPEHNGTNLLFMIWPEFEDENGQVILDDENPVPSAGIAQMWVIAAENRVYHLDKIELGLKGYFMEGSRRVAECEVIEILGLGTNPNE
ncbi:MAG TPA: hypothetical protein VK541_22890 [Pedobacter sp.]|uniref:hypothetical protein n=1 Tax=Pedobacter sp. TaxID=1411316 RepID=UPI002BD7DBF8|nr:hypothetical protein [Pedobacter sp.]HMI05354.1 hypothetical protein [Pedobacter sp.]